MYSIGWVIKTTRERRRISQEELCFGLCSVSSLSRIENNDQVPTMDKAIALLERLGLEAWRYLNIVSEQELEQFKVFQNIKKLITFNEFTEAYDCLMEYEYTGEKNCLYEQFFLYVTATKASMVVSDYEQAITLTEEAIRFTYPNFDSKNIKKNYYTDVEVGIINVMAVSYWKCGRHLEAINLLMNLVELMLEEYGLDNERNYLLPMLLCNLSKWLINMYRLEEAEHYVDIGLGKCAESNRYRTLPNFLCLKASIASAQDNIDRCLEFFKDAYAMFLKMNLEPEAENLRNFVIEKLNRDITRIVILEPDWK